MTAQPAAFSPGEMAIQHKRVTRSVTRTVCWENSDDTNAACQDEADDTWDDHHEEQYDEDSDSDNDEEENLPED